LAFVIAQMKRRLLQEGRRLPPEVDYDVEDLAIRALDGFGLAIASPARR
jgi:hypothetical protein